MVTGNKRVEGLYPHLLWNLRCFNLLHCCFTKATSEWLYCQYSPILVGLWCWFSGATRELRVDLVKVILNMFCRAFFWFCWLCCSEPRWAAHPQDEAELPGGGPVLQRRAGIVGEKTDGPRQNDGPARQGGDVPCTLPRWNMCVCMYLWVFNSSYSSTCVKF